MTTAPAKARSKTLRRRPVYRRPVYRYEWVNSREHRFIDLAQTGVDDAWSCQVCFQRGVKFEPYWMAERVTAKSRSDVFDYFQL